MLEIHKRYPLYKLKIFGEGPEKGSLLRLIHDNNAENYIELMGNISDLENVLYQETRVFVMTSDYEGFPNALAEAMAMGIPSVSTDCPTGPKELIGEKRGILVPCNSPDLLFDAISKLIDYPVEALEMGKNAKEFVKDNLSASITVEKLLENITRITKE